MNWEKIWKEAHTNTFRGAAEMEKGKSAQTSPANPVHQCPRISNKYCQQALWCDDKARLVKESLRDLRRSAELRAQQGSELSQPMQVLIESQDRSTSPSLREQRELRKRSHQYRSQIRLANATKQAIPSPSTLLPARLYPRWLDLLQSLARIRCLLAETNPDQWKNKYLSALGKLDGDVMRLNQRWEMDGTPADWEFPEGRYTASVVIDLFARRPKILFSKTPRTETNKLLLRSAILDWGVPECAKTDNGTDYVSREMSMFFEEMGIEHRLSAPFSPWEKGHVERFIKTYLHSMLEMLDNFIGHSVADRKQIEAKRTFAENLFKKNAVVKVDMSVAEMQQLTDQWIDGVYMMREHRSLGMTPLEKIASYTGSIRRITNERALDILLAKPVKTMPTITKKGIRYDNATFIHAELPQYIGELADIRLDPQDLGKIIVYVDGKFLCIAECPERTGMDRQEVAAHGRAKQKAFVAGKKAEFKAARRSLPMSTQDLVKDLLISRAAKSGKVTVLAKRAEEHATAALAEAARVVKAQETPQVSPEHAQILLEARQMAAKARNPNPTIIELPTSSRATPLEGMSDEKKYALWMEFEATVRAGGNLTEAWQQRFHAGYPRTSAYRAQQAMHQEKSPAEQQL